MISQYRTGPGDDVPVVLSRDGAHGPVVHCVNTAARGRGVKVKDRVVDAQAIHPDLHVEAADLDYGACGSKPVLVVQDGDSGLITVVALSANGSHRRSGRSQVHR